MKIIFALRWAQMFHYYEGIIEELCTRGHTVLLVLDKERHTGQSVEHVERFMERYPLFKYETLANRKDWQKKILLPTRNLLSYRRYLLHPEQAEHWRHDWLTKAFPRWTRPFFHARSSFASRFLMSRPTGALLRFIERSMPAGRTILSHMKKHAPHIVVAAPVNMRNSSLDTEYVKAAASAGVPTVIPVISWDNLTVRGTIPIVPTRLLAWNEYHKKEAMMYHGIPAERIRIIGSPFFDVWFSDLAPSMKKEDFFSGCRCGSDTPMIVYLGSSKNITRNERWVVERLRAALDAQKDTHLQKAHIVIRPHPAHSAMWNGIEAHHGISVFPKKGTLPDSSSALQSFYDTFYNADAVMGVNTSAMIDALIVGKPVVTFMPDEYKGAHEQSLHFQQLFRSGAVASARTIQECMAYVSDVLSGNDALKEKRDRFITSFVRPYGREISARERGADEIEDVANVSKEHESIRV